MDKDVKDILIESFDKMVECKYCKELLNSESPHESVYCPNCKRELSKDEYTVKVG